MSRFSRNTIQKLMLTVFSLLCGLVVCAPNQAAADELARGYFDAQSQQLQCVAEELDEEIPTHLKGVEGYRKMLGVNAQIRRRASSVGRRIERDSDYRRLDENVEKLQALSVELNSLYNESIALAERDLGRQLPVGDTGHVAVRISQMVELSDSMRAAVENGLIPVVVEPLVVEPTYVAPAGVSLEPAGAVAPAWETPEFVAPALNAPALNAPALNAPEYSTPTMTAPAPVATASEWSVSKPVPSIDTRSAKEGSVDVRASRIDLESPAPEKTEAAMHSVLEQ